MKKIKVLFLGSLIMTLWCSLAIAGPLKVKDEAEIKSVVETYVSAHCHGESQALIENLSDNAVIEVYGLDKMISYKKSTLVNFLNSDAVIGVEQNCTTEYQILEDKETSAKIAITFNYPTFTQINTLYLIRDEASGLLKIQKIEKTFE